MRKRQFVRKSCGNDIILTKQEKGDIVDKYTLSVKVDKRTVEKMKKFCSERGLKYGFFVEKSLEEKLLSEELKEDILDLKEHRKEEPLAVPLEEYIKVHDV